MSAAYDFQARIASVNNMLRIGEATAAATECVKLIEQALRQMAKQYRDQIDESVRRAIDEAATKRVGGEGGLEKLTMGQMINTLRNAKFWDEWARVTGKSLNSLQVIDLDKLAQLRNKVMHDGAEATRTEAEFLLHGLKMILETFGLVDFDAVPPNQSQHFPQNRQHLTELPSHLQIRMIDFFKSLPNFANEQSQRAFMYSAGFDAELHAQIRFNLPLSEFIPHFVIACVNYGEMKDGRYALNAALETCKQYVGKEKQGYCQSLIQELSGYLETAALQPEASSNYRQENREEQTMSTQEKPRSGTQFGNISFGKIGGNTSVVQVGGDLHGDVVGGNNVIKTTTTITHGVKQERDAAEITHGFKQERDKTEFLQRIDELLATLREIRTTVGTLDGLDDDQTDEINEDVTQQVKDLKTVKETFKDMPAGTEAPKGKAEILGTYLDATAMLMDTLKQMGEATAASAEKIAPTLASVRRLFGLL